MSFTGLLNQSISIYNKTGLDAFGKETVGSATSIPARFQRVNKNIMTSNGNVVPIDAIVFVAPSATVNNDDRITYDSINYKVVERNSVIGSGGAIHHYELKVVKWQS